MCYFHPASLILCLASKPIKARGEKEKKYMKTNRNKQIFRRHVFLFIFLERNHSLCCAKLMLLFMGFALVVSRVSHDGIKNLVSKSRCSFNQCHAGRLLNLQCSSCGDSLWLMAWSAWGVGLYDTCFSLLAIYHF